MTRRDPRAAGPLVAGACTLLLLFPACAIDLRSLAPFPCGADGTCPDGFHCETETGAGKCMVSVTCGNDSDCQGMGAFYCKSSTCRACNTVQRCGSTCQPCTEALPVCGASGCVQCAKDADCLGDGASCSSNVCQCATGTACGNTCVDLQTSDDNCGTCGHVCAAGSSCKSGFCSATCAKTCRADQVCISGSCSCAPGLMVCDASCAQCAVGEIATCVTTTGLFFCCPVATPVYCEQYPNTCRTTDVYCESIVKCSDGSFGSCPDSVSQFFNCASKLCEDCSAACMGQACGGAGCANCGTCTGGKVCATPGKCVDPR